MSSRSTGWRSSKGRATRSGRGSLVASPTRRGETRWRETALRLDLVDLGEDLLVLREAVGHLVVVGHLPVDLHCEDTAGALLEVGGDAVLVLDGGLQTGGLGEVVSLPAVRDQDPHPILLRSVDWPPTGMIRSGVRGVN